MNKINYKSDFDFILRLYSCNGDEVGWPDYDWTAKLWTSSKANTMEVWCKNGECHNCYNDAGKIHVVADNHRLGPGQLKIEFTAFMPNEVYPDHDERIVSPGQLDIMLIREAAPCPEIFEVELVLPYIKGEPFSFDDFTPEQIAELQKPALDKVAEVDDALKSVDRKETEISEAERSRVSAENKRVIAERERVENEVTRVAAEDQRKNQFAEMKTTLSSAIQVTGEAAKKADEAANNANDVANKYADELESKAARTELSNVIASDPLPEWEAPEFPAYRRLFIDMWNSACGTSGRFNIESGFFELNGITDISYTEATGIYAFRGRCECPSNSTGGLFFNYPYRTALNVHAYRAGGNGLSARSMFSYSSRLEAVSFTDAGNFGDWGSAFKGCSNLRRIYRLQLSRYAIRPMDNAFDGCPKLEYVEIEHAWADISFKDCPLITLECLEYIVDHAANNKNMPTTTRDLIITLHADTYARLTDELIAKAADKRITFATS